MDGYAQKLQYFGDENILLEVPFFQRPYVWEEKNWEALWNSIIEAKSGRMPFIGSFIFQNTKEEKKYLIIDGQQRITTLSIFIKAYLDVIGNKLDPTISVLFKNMIYEMDTTDDLKPVYTPRLTPSNSDKIGFDLVMKLVTDKDAIEKNTTNIVGAYKYFLNRLSNLENNQLMAIGSKIKTKFKFFIIIELEIQDDEQKIFDSVNNLGQRLTCADIIKNYLFQRLRGDSLDEVRQKEVMKTYYETWDTPFYGNDKTEFWYKEKHFGKQNSTNLEEFLKDLATILGIYKSSKELNLSEAYKKYIDLLDYNGLKKLCENIRDYSNAYFDMISDFEQMNDFRVSDKINATLLILNELESTTFTPVVLNLYKTKPEGYEDELYALQRFVITRLIYGASIKNYNKIAEVLVDKSSSTQAIEYLNEYNNNSNLPLREYPIGLSFIPSRSDNKANLILFLIEMIRRNKIGEDKYSDTLIYNKTLEHIIPQKWKKWELTPCYDYNLDGDYVVINNPKDIVEVRNKKIYSIGNMALLTGPLNSSIGNDIIEIKINGKVTKKTTREGIRKFVGSLSITNEIVKKYDVQHSWDERDINQRAEDIFNELNDYFKFTTIYVKKNMPTLYIDVSTDSISQNNVKDALSDEFLNNESIGAVVKESMKYLMKNNLLSEEDIHDLMDQKFSSKNLGCWLPSLAIEVEDKNRKRYYKDFLEYKGVNYLLCKELYKEDRKIIVDWIKSKLK